MLEVPSSRRSRGRLPISAALALAAAAAVPAARGAAESDDVYPLEEIIVETTRLKKPLERVPASVGVVDRDDVQLARQQLGLDESLVKIPGVFMQNRFNFAQDLRVSIRGFGARSSFGIRGIKILVDGIPETLPDGQGGVDGIDLGSTRQIEVIRGPSSSLYGNASGGVISIASEDAPEVPFVEPSVAFGDFSYRRYQLKAGGRQGAFSYLVNASDMQLDGYRQQNRTENTQFNTRLAYKPDASSSLKVVINVTDQPVADDPGGITQEDAEADPRQARDANVDFDAGEALDQQRLGLVYEKTFGELHALQARNYYVWRDFANKLPFTGGGAVDLDRFFFGGGVSYTYSGPLAGKPNRVIVGVDYDDQDDDRLRFDNNLGVLGDLVFDQNEGVTSLGVFVQNELTLRSDLELTLGLRFDRVEFDVDDRFLGDGDDSGKRTLEETSPMAGLLYAPTPEVNLFATISTAFQTPTTTEFANPSGGGFNPALDPETATNYEIGVKGTVADRHRYELTLFKIDVEDELIPFELASSPGRDFFQNAGESNREGVELAVSTRPVEGLEASLAYTYSDFTFDRFVTDDGDDFSGNVIPGTPENLLHGELAYFHPSGVFGIWDFLYVDEVFANNDNSVKDSDYTVANLRLGYRGSFDAWSVTPYLGVNNLFDESYNTNVRINAFGGRFFEPAPDRNVYGGVTVRYDFR